LHYEELQTKFAQYGPIKSLKISINEDHSQRGFAFICYENAESAKNAAEQGEILFKPKDDRTVVGKLVNNLYFKNVPKDMEEKNVKELFAPFGEIKSLIMFSNDIGQFGFVCYDDPENNNKEYGPACVKEAISKLASMEMGNGLRLYVREALSKSQREQEKKMDTIKYKNSKKRVNLYVKNFPSTWTDNDLREIFQKYGEIENVRHEKGATGNAYAFVCFKQPDNCAAAKQALQNQCFDGKVLIINNYEIKEFRDQQMADLKDKADFEKYRQQQTGGFQWNDLTSSPHLTQIIQQLMSLMTQNDQMIRNQQTDRNMGQKPGQQNNQRRHYQN